MLDASDAHDLPSAQERIEKLDAALVETQGKLAQATQELARLRNLYNRTLERLSLLQRRIFMATAERADVAAEQLAFDSMFEQAKAIAKELADADASETSDPKPDSNGSNKGGDGKAKKGGRRNVADLDAPVIVVEVTDPELEGVAERIGVEETWQIGFERGGMRRILIQRVVYKVAASNGGAVERVSSQSTVEEAVFEGALDAAPSPLVAEVAAETTASATTVAESTVSSAAERFVTTPLPKQLFRRSLLAPSMIAHILVSKYLLGVPFYRLEQQFALQGVSLDRGTMCRYAEDTGATLGAIVEATRIESFNTALCLSTDATGVRIQPGPIDERADKKRGPCRKGHFFVVLADKDHVFFEYQPKHTSVAVCEMFKGFKGYIQADAHAVYDALFLGTPPRGAPKNVPTGPPPTEVGCWSHARTNFWEATVCKHALGVEGLRRIDAIFAADKLLAGLPPQKRKARRDVVVRPLVDTFFAWVKAEYARPRERGLVETALGYAVRQELPLRRFLEDGRLVMTNNGSERALRAIASARKVWLFFGSDDHASAAANLFSLVAGCKLHRLDPEAYLADVIRVMPYWPRDRYLELSPKYWARTRARLDPVDMARPLGHVTVPAPLPAEQQQPTS